MTGTGIPPILLVSILAGCCISMVACKGSDSNAQAPSAAIEKAAKPAGEAAAAGDEDTHEGLHLKPEEASKLGVVTEPAKAATHAPEATGYGIVLSHETIAQSFADLRTAAAVARQSRSALERIQRLTGTPGAMPTDSLEAAQRQAAVDQAALELARQRLSSTFGQKAPWHDQDENAILKSLASGQSQLVRVTFPMNSLIDDVPHVIRLGRIGLSETAKTWDSASVWNAPADSSLPGRSFFTLLRGNALGESERVIAWTPQGPPADGVLIPASAVVLSAGKYWCYVEGKPDSYERTEIDPAYPVSGGYFAPSGVEPGAKIVVMAAGQLLARELNPSTEAE